MAQGKRKVKSSGNLRIKKSGGSIKKNKGKTRKGQRIRPCKKQNADLNNMKKNYEKLLKQKVECEAAAKVALTEPRSLKFVKKNTDKNFVARRFETSAAVTVLGDCILLAQKECLKKALVLFSSLDLIHDFSRSSPYGRRGHQNTQQEVWSR
ncbi:hypothetical protein ACTXT7_008382 [Hymenolepis weldensis]